MSDAKPDIRECLQSIAIELHRANDLAAGALQLTQHSNRIGDNLLDLVRAGQVAALQASATSPAAALVPLLERFLPSLAQEPHTHSQPAITTAPPTGPPTPTVRAENGMRVEATPPQ